MWQNILSQAIPLTVAQLVHVLYNMVDRMYLGHLAEESSYALTGVGIVMPVISLICACFSLFSSGGAPLCSIARGEGNLARAEQIMGNTFSMLFGTGAVLMLFGYLFQTPLLYLFGASEKTLPYASQYFSIYLAGTLFVTVGSGMNAFINAQGFARIGMMTTLLGAVLNILLDPLFIYVLEWGVGGAALATVISQAVSAVWVMQFLLSKRAILRLRVQYLKPEGELCRKIASLGLSGFIANGTNSLVQTVCNRMLNVFGGDLYIGIMTIIGSVREILSMPVSGLASGAQAVLSFNYGAKEYRRVRKGIVFLSVFGVIYTTLMWGLILLLPETLIRIYSSEAEMVTYGVPALRIYFFGYCMMALQYAGQTVFTSLGRAKQAIFFSLFRKAVIVAPLTVILPYLGLGVDGVFWAEPISNVLGGGACFCVMMLTVWRMLRKREEECAE